MANDKPIQYIKGEVEFYKLKFKVTPDALIPRPETELLVDQVLNSSLITHNSSPITILDIGTGAGPIAISIAKNLPNVEIIATDISAQALEVAKQNAQLHQIEDKIKFINSNLLSAFSPTLTSGVHPRGVNLKLKLLEGINSPLIIVTNLPYIPSARIPYLDSSVKNFEPHLALDGGEDGFDLYRKLFDQIKQKDLRFDLLVGEIDYTHGELAVIESLKAFPQAQVEVKKDLAHLQRILTIKA